MQALRAIWVQQFYRDISPAGEKVTRREAGEHGLPPGRLLLHSPCDTAVRYSEKRGKGWHGYKVHVSETCSDPAGDDPRTGRPAVPNLITNVATTPAHLPAASMTGPAHATPPAPDPTPRGPRAARPAQGTNTLKARYQPRAGIEGPISQAAPVTGIRRARYTGDPGG